MSSDCLTDVGYPCMEQVQHRNEADMKLKLAESLFELKNHVTVKTLKFKMLDMMMAKCGMSMEYICKLFATHVPVDEHIRVQFLKCLSMVNKKEWDIVLAQDFVKKDRIQKICQTLIKAGYENVVHGLLAVDGLKSPKWCQNPNYDIKRYFDNLRINVCGTKTMYSNGNDETLKQSHVTGVRRVYELLYKINKKDETPMCKKVYKVMRTVLNSIHPNLKLNVEEPVKMSASELEKCVSEYKKYMTETQINRLLSEVYHLDMNPKRKRGVKSETDREPKRVKRETEVSSDEKDEVKSESEVNSETETEDEEEMEDEMDDNAEDEVSEPETSNESKKEDDKK